MYLEANLKRSEDNIKVSWSDIPFKSFKTTIGDERIIGEGDFYKSDGLEQLLSKNFCVDGRYIYLSVSEEVIRIYVDKCGFVKPYVRIFGETLYVTTEPKYIYSTSNGFSKEGVECFLELGYVPPPYSLYPEWKVIPPGYFIEVSRVTSAITFKKWWLFETSQESYSHKSFWSHFNHEIATLENPGSTHKALLLSGGIDSRLISGSIEGPKKTFFMKMNGFSPDEADDFTINNYNEKIRGEHKKTIIDLKSPSVPESFIHSTYNGIDHAHMGKWKFYLFQKEIAGHLNNGIVLNGQTADTLLMKNITGDHFTCRMTRALYSKNANVLNLATLRKVFGSLSHLLPRGKAVKIRQIIQSWGTSDYFTGYLLNPGYIPGQRNNRNAADSVLKEIIEELINSYDSNIDLIITDLLLRTFIWGMDMRGIEDSSKAFNIKSRFVFMQGLVG